MPENKIKGEWQDSRNAGACMHTGRRRVGIECVNEKVFVVEMTSGVVRLCDACRRDLAAVLIIAAPEADLMSRLRQTETALEILPLAEMVAVRARRSGKKMLTTYAERLLDILKKLHRREASEV